MNSISTIDRYIETTPASVHKYNSKYPMNMRTPSNIIMTTLPVPTGLSIRNLSITKINYAMTRGASKAGFSPSATSISESVC